MNYPVNHQEQLIIQCCKCKKEQSVEKEEVMSSFELNNTYEKEMGVATEYLSILHVQCECDNEIEINITVWEYPENNYNADDDNVEIDNGELISCFPLSIDFKCNIDDENNDEDC